jgi:hypothetical protein
MLTVRAGNTADPSHEEILEMRERCATSLTNATHSVSEIQLPLLYLTSHIYKHMSCNSSLRLLWRRRRRRRRERKQE